MKTFWFALCSMLLLVTLTACGDDGSSSEEEYYTVAVDVDGVPYGETVTLALKVTVPAWDDETGEETEAQEQVDTMDVEDGTFEFEHQPTSDQNYTVVILTQPQHATCRVENGYGDWNTESPAVVSCEPIKNWTLGGTVSGLPKNELFVITESHSGKDVTVLTNGEWSFEEKFEGDFELEITTQPSGTTCTVSPASGTFDGADVSVTVTCTPDSQATFQIGGTLSGLPASSTLVLQNNGGDDLTLTEDGDFAFDTHTVDYEVTVLTQPDGANCTVDNASGTATAKVTDVSVTCTPTTTPVFEIGGTLSGLPASATIVLQNNDGDDLTLTEDGDFAFDTHTVDYEVTIKTQPDEASCVVDHGIGTATADVTDVSVTCTPVFEIGGTLSGLPASTTIVLQNNGGDDLTLTEDGDFAFDTHTVDYEVTVLTQPDGANCTATMDAGTATADVADVTVTCVPTIFEIGGMLSGLPDTRSLVLQNNGGDDLMLDENGAFSFETHTDDYDVTLATQPIGAVCTVTSGSGTATAAVADVAVTCIPSGTLDTTFGGGDGWVRYQPTVYHNEWYGLALNPDDTMTLCGRNQVGGADEEWVVSKLTTTSGTFDTFGTGGSLGISGGFAIGERAQAIRRASDGSYYVAGQMDTMSMGQDFSVAKVTTAGALDEDYATAGLATYLIPGAQVVGDMALYDSGAVLVVGRSNAGPDTDLFLVRFDADGMPDSNFGSDGMVFSGTTGEDEAKGVAVDAEGGIIVVGYAGDDSVVWKFQPDGMPDNDFGTNGKKTVDFSGLTLPDQLRRVQLDANGNIVAAGIANNGTNNDFLIVRFAPNGDLDEDFGADGIVKVDNSTDDLFALRIAPDGKILYGGITGLLAALGRLNADGSVDTGFATQGLFTNSFSSFASNINDIAIDSHDRIVVAGSWAETNPDYGVARLNP